MQLRSFSALVVNSFPAILYLVPRYYLKGLRWDLQTLKVNPFGMLCVSLATDLKPSLGLGMTAFNTLVGLTIILTVKVSLFIITKVIGNSKVHNNCSVSNHK